METIGNYIYELRIQRGLTQDQFGKAYRISGPAVFKFEKGFVKPSLDLWLKISKDVPLTERVAVLVWIKERLPEHFQCFINISKEVEEMEKQCREEVQEMEKQCREEVQEYVPVYSQIENPTELRAKIGKDKKVPEGLKKLFSDDEIWALYKPTGREMDFLVEHFGQFKNAGKDQFREAIRLYREFAKTKN